MNQTLESWRIEGDRFYPINRETHPDTKVFVEDASDGYEVRVEVEEGIYGLGLFSTPRAAKDFCNYLLDEPSRLESHVDSAKEHSVPKAVWRLDEEIGVYKTQTGTFTDEFAIIGTPSEEHWYVYCSGDMVHLRTCGSFKEAKFFAELVSRDYHLFELVVGAMTFLGRVDM